MQYAVLYPCTISLYCPCTGYYRTGNRNQPPNYCCLFLLIATILQEFPIIRKDSNCLYYHYECIEEWLIDELENEECQSGNSMISELNIASYYGDAMLGKMYNPYHLNVLEKRIECYKFNTDFEKDCLSFAKQALALMFEYPSDTIFQNTSNREFENEEGLIRAEQFIYFIADTDGALYENIARLINDEFNECSEIEEPTLLQIYDAQSEFTP